MCTLSILPEVVEPLQRAGFSYDSIEFDNLLNEIRANNAQKMKQPDPEPSISIICLFNIFFLIPLLISYYHGRSLTL